MNNSAYSKTMENLRKRINVRLVNNAKDYLKYVSKPTFVSEKHFSENFAAIRESKPVLVLNKPICVGFTVFELSKYLMYDFHYNFIKKKFDAELLFIDTGSLTYEIKSKDVYEVYFKYEHLFDLSNYPKDSKFPDSANKMVIGKMKDELKRIPISKFIELKSKVYCIDLENGKEVNTAKGVNISIEFQEYKNVSFNKKLIRHQMRRIQSKLHKLCTYDVFKISLSCFDDKRYLLNDEI